MPYGQFESVEQIAGIFSIKVKDASIINTFLRFLDKAFINKDSSQFSSDLFLRAIAVKAIYIWCRSGPELFYRIRRGKDLS